MRSAWLLTLTLIAAEAIHSRALTLELRVFNGSEEVTSQSRASVHRAGQRSSPVAQLSAGFAVLTSEIPPDIYDVQVIREREGRVVNIRWAERLVVMPYPDEEGRHLEVINFQAGFGALEVRLPKTAPADVALYSPGDRQRPLALPSPGDGYELFVVAAGVYDLQLRVRNVVTWQTSFEVPLDRTRLWIAPEATPSPAIGSQTRLPASSRNRMTITATTSRR